MTNYNREPTVLHTISPVDGSIVVTKELATREDIQQTVEHANFAGENWRLTSLAERKYYCSKAIDNLLLHKEMIASELSWMMGRPIRYGHLELSGVEERARYMIAVSDEALAPIHLDVKLGYTWYIKRVPLGTVLVIAPWNYPYLTAVNSIIPALLAGNTVILKHSSQTPLCAERFQQAFDEAGLTEGVFQHLYLSHENTENVVASERIQHVVFTGSVQGGKVVEKASAGRKLRQQFRWSIRHALRRAARGTARRLGGMGENRMGGVARGILSRLAHLFGLRHSVGKYWDRGGASVASQ